MRRFSKLPYALVATLVVALPAAAQFLPQATRFTDVPNTAFFASAAESFSRIGIIKGYDDGRFGGYDYVTRGQVAVMLQRYDDMVVRPLRLQIIEMSKRLNLPYCSDGAQQTNEQCDDGNVTNGDGCSEHCIAESFCAGGYRLGDSFPASDGCNMCTCTESGISCTKRLCTQRKCFSTSECLVDEYCSVDAGDCLYPCPAGATCIRACGGICLPRFGASSQPAQLCGNGRCDAGEVGFLDRTGSSLYCPQDCSAPVPDTCGNGVCEVGEADEYQLGGQTPLQRGTCPTDCEGGLSSCDRLEQYVDGLFTQNLACQSNEDCAIFIRGCSPYQTCGKPVSASALQQVSEAVQNYVSQCEETGVPQFCAACLQVTAACVNNTCQLVESVQ